MVMVGMVTRILCRTLTRTPSARFNLCKQTKNLHRHRSSALINRLWHMLRSVDQVGPSEKVST